MKKLRILCLTVVACAAIGCSDDENLGIDDALRCQGRLGIDGAASATVVSRAEIDLAKLCGFTAPNVSELRLALTGTYTEYHQNDDGSYVASATNQPYAKQWKTLDAYNKPALYPGVYTAVLAYGDPDAKGPNKPYFRGEGKGEIEWDADKQQVKEKEVNCKIPVKIANSAVLITADDGFKGYFSDPQFQLYLNLNGSTELLKDDAGNAYVFTLSGNDKPIFLPAGTNVVVKGTVRRPSQTTPNDADGKLMEIEVSRTTAAGTLHTFQFTAKAGGVGVDVEFKDYGAGSPTDVELNDDSETE